VTAVVLLSHGSPDPRSGDAARLLAQRVARCTGEITVAAFLQHDDPDLVVQCRVLADAGITEAAVVPMLITPAFHARVDVPAAVHDAESRSGVRLTVSEPIGTDPRLLDAMDCQLPPGPIVLAVAGTSDPAAQVRIGRLAAMWSARRVAPVAVGHASQAAPDVASAIAGLESRTRTRVSVASFVLYPGVLPDRILAAAGGRLVTPPLAQAPEIVDLIRERIREARSVRTTTTSTTPNHERTPA
jgi:sirohydrochlorin ferrochelatase